MLTRFFFKKHFLFGLTSVLSAKEIAIIFKITSCFNICFNDSILYFFLLTQSFFFVFFVSIYNYVSSY
jgi:hypothetical protein